MRSLLRGRSALSRLTSRCRGHIDVHHRSVTAGMIQHYCVPWAKSEARRFGSEVFWSEEWKRANLKATQASDEDKMEHVLFIECGMGCDQHGSRDKFGATVGDARAHCPYPAPCLKFSSGSCVYWTLLLRRVRSSRGRTCQNLLLNRSRLAVSFIYPESSYTRLPQRDRVQ